MTRLHSDRVPAMMYSGRQVVDTMKEMVQVLEQSELDKLKVGKTVTVTYTIKYIGDKHESLKTVKGRVVELSDRHVVLTARPIRGLSSNVTQHVGLSSVTEVKA